jgi:hypothetical protein
MEASWTAWAGKTRKRLGRVKRLHHSLFRTRSLRWGGAYLNTGDAQLR